MAAIYPTAPPPAQAEDLRLPTLRVGGNALRCLQTRLDYPTIADHLINNP
jgi:hypothetical protein